MYMYSVGVGAGVRVRVHVHVRVRVRDEEWIGIELDCNVLLSRVETLFVHSLIVSLTICCWQAGTAPDPKTDAMVSLHAAALALVSDSGLVTAQGASVTMV
jgi:hypothetical protein